MKNTRFRHTDVVDEILSPDSPIQKKGFQTIGNNIEYDIKGNTYKNTLIPEKSAKSAFSRHRPTNNSTVYGQSFVDAHKPVKPRYKGYVRSGQILFNNINQINTREFKTPKASGNHTVLGRPSQLFVNTNGVEKSSRSTEKLHHSVKQKDHMSETMK